MSDVAAIRERAERAAQAQRMSRKPREAFTLVLDGLEVPVLSGRVSRTLDTVADGWSAEIAWTPGKDRALDERVAPYSYCKAQVYLGPNLVNTGRLYTVSNSLTETGLVKQLEGWSYTADLVDSHIQPKAQQHVYAVTNPQDQNAAQWGYEWRGSSVLNICSALCGAFGIQVKTDIGDVTLPGQKTRTTEFFEQVQAELTETYADLFCRLASQRGMLVSNDAEGNLFLTAARTRGAPVASLEEGKPPARKLEAKFDGRKRFYKYTVYGQSGMGDDIQATALDEDKNHKPRVPTGRMVNYRMGDVTAGNVGIAAAWRRSKQLADALTIPFPVVGWYAPRGELWAPNTLVSVTAPSIHVDKGFTFLVRAVEYVDEASGLTSTLSLVPPQVYTGEEIIEPW